MLHFFRAGPAVIMERMDGITCVCGGRRREEEEGRGGEREEETGSLCCQHFVRTPLEGAGVERSGHETYTYTE